MKKTGLLMVLMALLVAANGYAQDSYREAVKQYLTALDQFEESKSLISPMSILFETDGQVDIEQLTKRYFDEQFEDDMIDWFMSVATVRDMTEADLREVASLLSSPEGKAFEDHHQEWMGEFLANWMTPFMSMGERVELEEDEDWSHGGLADLLGPPIQPKADIDAAYAAKFNDVIMGSFGQTMMDAMIQRFNEDVPDDPEEQESNKALVDWITASVPAVLLNSAYGILTLEDLDYASILYANESYCKLNSNGTDDLDNLKVGHFMVKYMDWMKEQGATVSEDPEKALEFWKAMFNKSLGESGHTLIDKDDEPEKPWYDLNFGDIDRRE